MAVTSALRELLKMDAFPSKAILARFVSRTMERLNGLYEALTDEKAPGSASQSISGHDHSLDFGGSPIPRSCTLSVDTGLIAHIQKTETVKGQVTSYQIGPRYISPGVARFDTSTATDVAVFIAVYGGTVNLWAGGGYDSRVTVEITGEGLPRWVTLRNPLFDDDVFSILTLSLSPQTDTSTTWQVYAVNEAENWALSIPEIGHRYITSNIGAVGTVLEYFGTEATLDSDLAVALETLDAYTLKILLWSLNALYTHTVDEMAPGTSSQAIQGHDHFKIAVGGQGGRPIPRGCIYSAGASQYDWQESTCTVQNQWEYTDLDLTAPRRRSTGIPNAGTGAGATIMWEAYVTEGMNSSGNPPTTNPYLVAQVYVGIISNADVRIYNATTATLSPVVSVTPVVAPEGWIQINKVPCIGGTWNDFTLQIRCTSAGVPVTYETRQVALFECYSDGDATQNATVITSSGSGAAGVSRSGVQKVPIGGLP